MNVQNHSNTQGHHCDCGTCDTCETRAYKRNNYFTGKLMVERDFTDEQHYFREKMRVHHQRSHGTGVVCGLNIRGHEALCEARYVILEPGSAIDCCGQDILVVDDEIIDLEAFPAMQDILTEAEDPETPDDRTWDLQLCIRYAECLTEDVPVLYDECGCDDSRCAPNRILESYCLDLRVDPDISETLFLSPSLDWAATIGIDAARHVALDEANGRIFVLTGGATAAVYQVDAETLAIEDSFSLGREGLAVLPAISGAELFVVVADDGGIDAGDADLIVFDLAGAGLGAGPQRNATIAGSQSSDVALAGLPDGRLVALVSTGGQMHLWDATVTGAPDDLGPLDPATPMLDPVILGDARTLVTSADGGGALHRVDLDTPGPDTSVIALAAGTSDGFARVASTGPDLLAVVDRTAEALRLVDPTDGSELASVALEHAPANVVVSAGGHWAHVLLREGDASFVQSVNLDGMRAGDPVSPTEPVPVGDRALGLSLSETGSRLYVVYRGPDDPAGIGGVAVLDVTDTDCMALLFPPECPACESADCLVLATIRNYRPGDRILDMPDPAADPADGTAHIDNNLGRLRLPSTQAITQALLCLMHSHSGTGTGDQGPPGPPGAPGQNGTNGQDGEDGQDGADGLDATLEPATHVCAISWDHLGFYNDAEFPQIDITLPNAPEPIRRTGFAIAFDRQTNYFGSVPDAIRNSPNDQDMLRYASRLVRLRCSLLADAFSPVAQPDYTLKVEVPCVAVPAELALADHNPETRTCRIEQIVRMIPLDEDTQASGATENGLLIFPMVEIRASDLQAWFYRQILNGGSVQIPEATTPSYMFDLSFDGNALIDLENRPIDAEHVAPFLPQRGSGNNHAGSVFESAFYFNQPPRGDPTDGGFSIGGGFSFGPRPLVPVPGRIDLNTADPATLRRLPGIGVSTAARIMRERPFENEADFLARVSGIGPGLLSRLRDVITFGSGGTS